MTTQTTQRLFSANARAPGLFRSVPLLLSSAVVALLCVSPAAGAVQIVTVGTRDDVDVYVTDVSGTGPWVLDIDPQNPVPDVVAVGDDFIDAGGNGPYLITSISGDRTQMTVREWMDSDTPVAGGAWQGLSGRAFSSIGCAEIDIPTVAQPGDTWECHVYNDGAITEAPVLIDDITLGNTGTLKITVPESERHSGLAGSGVRWQQIGAGTGISLSISDSTPTQTVEFLEIQGISTSGAAGVRVSDSGLATTLRGLLIHGYQTTTASATGISIGDADVLVHNCTIYDMQSDSSRGIGILVSNGGWSARLLNCTVHNCSYWGLNERQNGGTSTKPEATNCAVFDCPQGAFTSAPNGFGWHASSDYNCSDDTSGVPGANSITGVSASSQFVSLTSGSEDYHLLDSASNDCIDAGTELSATFTDDIDGQYRVDAWDIGADEHGRRTFFVDAVNGDDENNDGLSPDSPWQTVAHINNQTFQPGDNILFKRGQDFGGWVDVPASGTTSHPIVLSAYGPRSAGSKPEDWTSPSDWPRIGYDLRIDAGSSWTLVSGNMYKTSLDLPALGLDDGLLMAAYRPPAGRDANGLPRRGLTVVQTTPGTSHYDTSADQLYVHLLDGSDPTNVHVYVHAYVQGPGEDIDFDGKFSVKIDQKDNVIVDGLHLICGRFGVRIIEADNCTARNCLATGHNSDAFIAGNDGGTGDGSANVLFLNNEVTESGCGFTLTTGSSGTIQDNYAHDLDPDRTRWTVPPDHEGIAVVNPGGTDPDGVEIVGNRIERVGTAAIITLITVDSSQALMRIHRNTLRAPFLCGFNVTGSNAYPETWIHHNLMIGQTIASNEEGILIAESAQFSPALKIINNTLIGTDFNLRPNAANITFKNNISTGPSIGRHISYTPETSRTTLGHERDNNCYHPMDETHTIDWGDTTYTDFGLYQSGTCVTPDTCSTQNTSCQECDSIDLSPNLDSGFRLTSSSPEECKTGGAQISWPQSFGIVRDLDGVAVSTTTPSMGAFQW